MAYTGEQAWELLTTYNEGEFHLHHARVVGDVMRWFAAELGHADEADEWEVVGILHDLDFERFPEEHCVRGQQLMREAGVPEDVVRSCASHGWGETACDVRPESERELVLYAVDELTGLIGAAALMRPSGSVDDMPVKSVRKKFKDKRFAEGCSREVIRRGAEMLGWELDELFARTLEAMRASDAVA